MSQINLEEGEISLSEPKNITASSGLHNLTASKVRFQPVRIKALLSLFESEDDDTEPQDSENDSGSESLQALPDDDEDHSSASTLPKDEEPPAEESVSKTIGNESGVWMSKNIPIEEQIPDKLNVYKEKHNDNLISSTSDSLDLKSNNALSSSIRKITLTAALKHAFSDADNVDGNKGTILTPQTSIDPMRRKLCSENSMVSDMKFEAQPESLTDFDNQSRSKDQSCEPVMETPMKQGGAYTSQQNSCLGHKSIFETPQTKLKNEHSHSAVETPGLIFSHWSRNNFFQTPTSNSIISSNKEGQINHQTQDVRLQPHRFYSTENRIVRKPLSEAMHLNQGSSMIEKPINKHVAEYQSIVKSNLSTKENYPVDNNQSIKDHIANKIMQSLQESNKQHDFKQQKLSAYSISNEKSICQNSLEMEKAVPLISTEQKDYTYSKNDEKSISRNSFEMIKVMPSISTERKDYTYSKNDGKSICRTSSQLEKVVPLISTEEKNHGLISSKTGISDQNVIRDGCTKKRMLQQSSKETLNSNNNTFGTEPQNGKIDAILSDSNNDRVNLPLPVPCERNPGNVQFSIVSKSMDKKYGKIINVKGSDYLVLGKLGQGMSGEVVRVQEVKTGELRAIKCVDLSCIEKETAQGCLEEVSMLHRLRAPCIINMFTYEIKLNILYVVMEMGDTDLSKLLKSMSRDKQLPLTMILYYWTEMLTAVKHIHDNGVIHSDLKPANFLLVRGRLKLIDFGIASTVNSDMTSVVKNTSLGTLNYISPEAINDIGGNGDSPGENNRYKINFKSDVWSLGCILYSLVYGQTPFQHIRANWAKVNAITNPNQKIPFPPPESTNRREYTPPPPFLVDVMRRCLQHDRMARPSVSQLLQIPYVGCNCPPVSSLPSIPPYILSKIKQSLDESEWRQLCEVLERRKPLQ